MITRIFWNSQEHRLRALWRLLIFAIAFVGVILLLPFLHTGALRALGGPGAFVADIIPYVILLGLAWLALWLAARFLDHRPLADYGFHWRTHWWKDFGMGLILGAGLFTALFLIEIAAGWISIAHTFYVSYPDVLFVLAIVGRIIFASAIGFWESMIFAGYPIRNIAEGLRSRFGLRGTFLFALILPAPVFGISHIVNPNATLASSAAIACGGILFGLVYVLTGNLALSIGFHLIGDFLEGSVFGWPVSGAPIKASFFVVTQNGPDAWTGGTFGPEAGLIALVFIVLAILLVLFYIRRTYGTLTWETPLAHYTPRSDKRNVSISPKESELPAIPTRLFKR